MSYSDFVRQYLTVALIGGLALALIGVLLGVIGALLRPDRPQEQKYITYESGVDPVGTGWAQSQIRYYIFALLFVMFDVEAVFIFPWAIRLEAYGTFGLVEMVVFIVILALGLVYAWRKKVLQVGLVESGKMPKPLTKLLNTSRKYSLWVYQWGLACCAIEMGAAFASPRYDVMRLGVIPLPGQPPPGRPRRHLGHRHRQDGPGHPRPLRADARPQVRDLHGLLRQLRRPVLGQLLGHQGRRPDHPGRRLRARAARRGPRRCSRASSCCRSASRTRTWPRAGEGEPIVVG